MAAYRIEVGSMVFDNSSIILRSLHISTAVDLAGAELAADIFTVVIDYEEGATWLFAPADYDGIITEDNYLFGTADITTGDLTDIAYGTPIRFYRDNVLFSKFYVRSIERVGKTKYAVTAMSAVGFLDNQRHYGGVYAGITVEDLIDEIIGSAFTWSIDVAVGDQYVSGWLPIDTARNNLHKVMFAFGISLTKDANGDIQFVFLSNSSPASVPNDRIFLGGSVDYPERVTDVEVWEHLFYKLPAASESIYTNNGGTTADHLMIEFSEPFFDLTADNALVINESGDNYAIVSGVGTLYGKKYFHATSVISQHIADAAVVPNVITSSEDALVNTLNSRSVLKRLASYYSSKKTVRADILLAGEKAGSVISFEDAFGDASTGIISEQNTAASSFLKADCKIITGYTPTGQGNFYHNRALITANGTWTVPAGVTDIRIALIGGGTGGQGGYDGEIGGGGIYDPSWGESGDLHTYTDRDRYLGEYYTDQPLKKGGAGGEPGAPGKTYVVDKTVAPGEVITIAVGSGGAGGSRNGSAGSAGTATTAASTSLGTLSSADGTSTEAGYYDVLGGAAFGAGGVVGYAGGDGGQTDTQSLAGWLGYAGLPGGDFDETYHGGAGGSGEHIMETESIPNGRYRASGGGGGGAAFGANGGAGTAGYIEIHGELDEYKDVHCGSGGKGADALPPAQAFYGCGGDGGNGGGAGGNAGGGYSDTYWSVFNDKFYDGERGQAGQGSVGGQGGAGCVIIYW